MYLVSWILLVSTRLFEDFGVAFFGVSCTSSFSQPAKSTKFWVSRDYQNAFGDDLDVFALGERLDLHAEDGVRAGALVVELCLGVEATHLSLLETLDDVEDALHGRLGLSLGEELVLGEAAVR